MSDPNLPDTPPTNEPEESFKDILSQYERSHVYKAGEGANNREGTVISLSSESVYIDIGFKTEGLLPLTALQAAGKTVNPGDKLLVTIKGRDPEGYYELGLGRVVRPTDWSALEKAFKEKATIAGTVTAVVKGGVTVDVGVRAFMPASRTGTRDAAEMAKLIGQEIRCRITKLDVAEEDLVVDRRAVLEQEEKAGKERRYSELKEGDVLTGTVRSLMTYGAFVDLGGVDALLHISDISWSRVNKSEDVLSVGQEVEVKVLKIDTDKQRVSVGMKQLLPQPWDTAAEKYKQGERVRGVVTRVTDFGAFVELEPGVEGLIHLSEMSWAKKAKRPSDVVKPGESVEAVVLSIDTAQRRISLGLKQTLGDPWADIANKFPVGSVVSGPVTSLAKFGAFVQLAEGVEGMIHIGDIADEKRGPEARIAHPQDVLKMGQVVKAMVLENDAEKRRIRLGQKQLIPTSLDEFIAEHKVGDQVTGRIVEVSGARATVELGEGIQANCQIEGSIAPKEETRSEGKADLSSLSSMLQARWKGQASENEPKRDSIVAGQVRSFKIVKLDADTKQIEVAPA
ncbi:MAG TPA: S1 RNA-binding domain-containing protein [candidate division Zixibacteria bacterium]|nr:S1 RNA-binding domain-containing protein [candidate division Zixibacteria bacterium]